MRERRFWPWRDWAAAGAAVLLALALRLPGLGQSPGWDGDEGYNVEIAWRLWHGQARFFALSYAFVQHPIGFYAILAPLLGLFGRDLVVARALAAVAGALAAGALYLAASLAGSRRTAALGALALAGAHFVVAYNRFAYTYNLLLWWSALTLLLVLVWDRTRRPAWYYAAAAAAALGWLTDQEGIVLALFVAAAALPDRRRAGLGLALGLAPGLLAALAALAWQPQAALQDWRVSLERVIGTGEGAAPGAGLARWLVNYLHLLRAEWWLPAAVAGVFAIRPLHVRRRVLLLAGLLAAPIFALRELEPFFRTGVPLLLPAAWGAGALLDAGIAAAYATFGAAPGRPARWGTRFGATAVAALAVALPLGLEIGRSAGALAAGFETKFDWALTRDQAAARGAAAYVNARTGPADVVIVSPHVSWLYTAQVADFFQALARQGVAVAFYPGDLPAARFRFDPRPQAARFVVVDAFWERWAAEVPPVAALLREVEQWELEWRAADVRVYRRLAP